jgi:CRISPR-associated protein Cas2
MELLLTYDVSTTTPEGQRRLRRVARICEGYGQRVQLSVFEVICSETGFAELLARLEQVVDDSTDSLRIYKLSAGTLTSVVTVGHQVSLPVGAAWVL